MIIRYALIAALVACLGLGAALWWQSGRVGALEAENARLTRNAAILEGQIDQARHAASVAAVNAQRERDLSAQTSATIETLLTADLGECADAELDPALANLLDGLREAR